MDLNTIKVRQQLLRTEGIFPHAEFWCVLFFTFQIQHSEEAKSNGCIKDKTADHERQKQGFMTNNLLCKEKINHWPRGG